MKYFNPSYWFKLWLLSAPLFNDKTQGINAKSIDNKNIKDWVSNNTSDISLIENQELTLSNNQTYFDLQTLNQELETSTHKHRHEKSRNKRDFYEKEKIEFFNNNFFYKFNVNYDNYKTVHDNENNISILDNVGESEKVIVSDWTKYAKNQEEFKQKFPEIEFVNYKVEWYMWSETKNKKQLKISTSKICEKNESNALRSSETEIINEKKSSIFGAFHSVNLWCYIFFDGNKIKFKTYAHIVDEKTTTTPWVKIKFDSIRLVGEIDVNPLFSLTVEKAKQFDIWASNKERELNGKKEDPNYNKIHLLNEENSFKENFKLWLLQIRHDYIQDLINISQNNEIINLKSEIDDIKSRLDELEKPKTCLDNIFDSFKKNTLSNAPSNTWNSIKENSESPLKVILKKSGKAFTTGLLTGVAKGSALGILSCVADSLLSSRKRREISNINDLEEKNVTKWTNEFTNSINNEQHLPIDNKTNLVTNNITSL